MKKCKMCKEELSPEDMRVVTIQSPTKTASEIFSDDDTGSEGIMSKIKVMVRSVMAESIFLCSDCSQKVKNFIEMESRLHDT